MANLNPVVGWEGVLSFDGIQYPAQQWMIISETERIPIPTVASCPTIDMLPGWTTGYLIGAGTGQRDFNPNTRLKQGTYHACKLKTNLGDVYEFPSAMVCRWEWGDEVKGVPTWKCLLYGNWKWFDWSGNEVA